MVLFTIMCKLFTALTLQYPTYKMGNSIEDIIELWVHLAKSQCTLRQISRMPGTFSLCDN